MAFAGRGRFGGAHQPLAAGEPVHVRPQHLRGQPPPVLRMRAQVHVDAGVHQRVGRQRPERNRARASANASRSVGPGPVAVLGADRRSGPDRTVENPVERDVGQRPAGPRTARDIAMRAAEPDLSIRSLLARRGVRRTGRSRRRSRPRGGLRRHWTAGSRRHPRQPHPHRVPQPQNCTGTAISRRRPAPWPPAGSPLPVLRHCRCARAATASTGPPGRPTRGGHTDGAEKSGQFPRAERAAANAENEDPVARFPGVDQERVRLGDPGAGVVDGRLRHRNANVRVPEWYHVSWPAPSSSRRNRASPRCLHPATRDAHVRSKHSTMFFTTTPKTRLFSV